MKKRFNIINAAILCSCLVVFHFGVGLLASPFATSFVIDAVNKAANTKVLVGRVNVWPLTLSVNLKDIKVFDPEKEDERILEVKDMSARISLLGLLSKRFSVSAINIDGVSVNVEGEPDGSFNIQRLLKPIGESGEKAKGTIPDIFKKRQDWFSKAYSFLKEKLSSEAIRKKKEVLKSPAKVTRDVVVLPKGRKVHFKTAKGRYLLEVKRIAVTGLSVKLKTIDGRGAEIGKALLKAADIGFDPQLGAHLGSMNISGEVVRGGVIAGSVDLSYSTKVNLEDEKAKIDVRLKDVDLDAVRFIYEDSLPVDVVKGVIDLSSITNIINGSLYSKNILSLKGHELKAKGIVGSSAGFMPIPVICNGLNSMNPANLDFVISGTLDKPEFSGLVKSIADIIKPSLGAAIPSDKAGIAGVAGSLKSLFNSKK